MTTTHSDASNGLLAALPQRERNHILELCENVTLAQDEILTESGEHIRHVYFPIDSFLALLTAVDRHDALAVDLIGSEGMLGASLVLGDDIAPLRARVQGAGNAWRMSAADFQRALIESPMLERCLRLYLSVELTQLAQTAACAAFHVVEARLACWLLMSHDRAHGRGFYLTHDRLARMLGVRRSGVTTAAGVLQGRKLIRYTRGHIAVLDRKGLEQAACGCYRLVRDAFNRVAGLSTSYDETEEGGRTDPTPLSDVSRRAPRSRREDADKQQVRH